MVRSKSGRQGDAVGNGYVADHARQLSRSHSPSTRSKGSDSMPTTVTLVQPLFLRRYAAASASTLVDVCGDKMKMG